MRIPKEKGKAMIVNLAGVLLLFLLLVILRETGALSNYISGVLMVCGIAIIMASSLNITVGYLGQVALGGCGFMSIGAYTAALITKAMEASGAAAITVHGRTREQFYTGEADWKIISEVKKNVKIPVIANGDVTDLKSCLDMYEQTGCDLVMIGRGSYGNPFVFKEISSYYKGEEYTAPTIEEKMSVMLRHIRLILDISEKSEELAIHEARKHAAWYMNGYYASAKFRARCYNLTSYSEAEQLAEEFIRLQHERMS